MPSSTDAWGIEVGANAIKALRLQRNGQSAVVTEFEVIPFKKVLTTPEIDVEESIRVGLDQFLARHHVDKATVVVSVPGHMAFARFAKLPPVEPKKVPAIVQFEAVQQIPFPIDQVEWDYQVFQFADSPDVEVGIFAITKERIARWLSNFTSMNLPVHGVTLAPVAAYNAIAYDQQMTPDSPGVILLDIGTSATDLVIVDSGRLWLRTIPIGGHHFTEALVRSFKLSYSKAEKIKREAATSKYARQIFQSMRPVFVDLVNEVQKSLGFYQSSNREVELKSLIGLGSTFKLPGLQKFIRQQLQIDVSRMDSFKRLEVDPRSGAQFAENAVSMAPAYGLALQGLELENVSANILPARMIRAQVWRRKQWMTMAAAAAMVACAAVPPVMLLGARQAANSSSAVAARAATEQTINDAQTQLAGLSEMSKIDPRNRIENLRGILEYRLLWPLVLEDINGAIASAGPQDVLLSGKVEDIQKIPRNQRNLIMLSQVTQEYKPPAAVMNRVAVVDENEEGAAPPPVAAPTVVEKPSFVVTLVGTTPRGDAPRFLNDTIIKYLMQRDARSTPQEKKDRPYRITHVELREVAINLTPGASGSAPPPPGPPGVSVPPGVTNAPPGVSLPGAAPPPAAPGPPGANPVFRPGEVGNVNRASIEQFMPSDPLAGEDRRDDHRFVVQFNVEILRPEDRKPQAAPQPPTAAADDEVNR